MPPKVTPNRSRRPTGKGGSFQCRECPKSFQTHRGLLKHEQNHKKKCSCLRCSSKFMTEEDLEAHRAKHHDDDKPTPLAAPDPHPNPPDPSRPYQCTICPAFLKSTDSWREHIQQVHGGEVWNCDVCNKNFASEKKLKEHKKLRHDADRLRFECGRCRKKFAAKHDASRHEKTCKAPRVQMPTDDPPEVIEPGAAGRDTNMADAVARSQEGDEDLEEFEDPQEALLTKLLKNLFSSESRNHVHHRLQKLRSVSGLFLQSNIPDTPTPAQQVIMGRNLKAFEVAQLVDFNPVLLPKDATASESVKLFLAQPKRRKLWVKFSMEDKQGIAFDVRVQNYDPGSQDNEPIKVGVMKGKRETRPDPKDEFVDFEVQQFMFDESSASIFAAVLRDILQRVPVLLRGLSKNYRDWLVRASHQVLMSRKPNLNVTLPMPVLLFGAKENRPHYSVLVHGYNHTKCYSWRHSVQFDIGTLDTDRDIQIIDEDKYSWSGGSSNVPSGYDYLFADTDFHQAERLAKMLSVKHYGFIGSIDDLVEDVRRTVSSYWIIGKQQTRLGRQLYPEKASKWHSQTIWQVLLSQITGLAHIIPTDWMHRRMEGSRQTGIFIYSTEPERILPILNAILHALQAGHPEDSAFGIGCLVADEMNVLANDPAKPIEDCTDSTHHEEFHVCPECFKLTKHDAFQKNDFYPYKVCEPCHQSLRGDAKDLPVKYGQVGINLLQHLKKENSMMEERRSKAEMVVDCNTIMDSLQHLLIAPGRYHDAYVNQTLDVRGAKLPTWDGARYNPKFPSIDAIDPFVMGKDGKTHYHDPKNITITADSINRALKHYPKVLLNAVLQMVESPKTGKAAYENGIGIFRSCVVNQAEYGRLGHAQQVRRVNKEAPKDMRAIQQSFRTAARLPRTHTNEQVWRHYYKRPRGTASERRKYRPPHFDWILRQLEYIAQEVFGDQAVEFRRYCYRKDKAGTDVFFPFSQYSEVPEWTWWELYEVLALKAWRNVNVCQKPYSRDKPVAQYSVEELLLVVANLWMRMVKKDSDAGMDDYDLGRDESGLVPWPTVCTLMCASLAHLIHGQYQELALIGFVLGCSGKVGFDPKKCGFLWETQWCNFIKFKYAPAQVASILAQLSKIRRGDPRGETRRIMPEKDLIVKLLDEQAFVLDVAVGQALDQDVFDADLLGSLQESADGSDAGSEADVEDFDDKDGSAKAENLGKDSHEHSENEEESQSKSDDAEVTKGGFDIFDNYSDFEEDALEPVGALILNGPRHNMTNLGSTCYAAVSLQILAHVPEMQAIFGPDCGFIPISGRDPEILTRVGDASGEKHAHLYFMVAQILGAVTSGNGKPGTHFTQAVLTASTAINKSFRNEQNDAAFYYNFLMSAMDIAMDQSKAIDKPDIKVQLDSGAWRSRPAYRPEEDLNQEHIIDVSADIPLPDLSEQLERHWQAHLESGHASSVTELTTIQCVELIQCASTTCSSIVRQITYMHSILLSIPDDMDHNAPISLTELMQLSFRDRIANTQECLSNVHATEPAATRTRYSQSITRVARAGLLFAVEIGRRRIDSVSSSEQAEENPSDDPWFWNRITDYESIEMVNWSNDESSLALEAKDDSMDAPFEFISHPSLDSAYKVVGIAAYSTARKHYVVFVKIETYWVYFDDLAKHARFRDPFSNWPIGFVETMLWFKREGDLPELEGLDLGAASRVDHGTKGVNVDAEMTDKANGIPEPPSNIEQMVQAAVGTLREEHGTLCKEHGALREEHEALHEQHGALLEQHGALREQHDTVRNELGALRDQHGALHEQHGVLREQHETVREEIGALRKEFDALKAMLNAGVHSDDTHSSPKDTTSEEGGDASQGVSRMKSMRFYGSKTIKRVGSSNVLGRMLKGDNTKGKEPKQKEGEAKRRGSIGQMLHMFDKPKSGSQKSSPPPTSGNADPFQSPASSKHSPSRKARDNQPKTPPPLAPKQSTVSLRQRRAQSGKEVKDLSAIRYPSQPTPGGLDTGTDASFSEGPSTGGLSSPGIPKPFLDKPGKYDARRDEHLKDPLSVLQAPVEPSQPQRSRSVRQDRRIFGASHPSRTQSEIRSTPAANASQESIRIVPADEGLARDQSSSTLRDTKSAALIGATSSQGLPRSDTSTTLRPSTPGGDRANANLRGGLPRSPRHGNLQGESQRQQGDEAGPGRFAGVTEIADSSEEEMQASTEEDQSPRRPSRKAGKDKMNLD